MAPIVYYLSLSSGCPNLCMTRPESSFRRYRIAIISVSNPKADMNEVTPQHGDILRHNQVYRRRSSLEKWDGHQDEQGHDSP